MDVMGYMAQKIITEKWKFDVLGNLLIFLTENRRGRLHQLWYLYWRYETKA